MSKIGVRLLSTGPVLVMCLFVSACDRRPEVVTFGTIGGIKDTLVFVATDEGYFREHGLEVSLKTYANGVAAIEGMLNGEVDVAYASEYVTVQQAFRKADLRIFAVEAQSLGTFVVGRKDRGIRTATDLRGKKVGVPRGAIPEYFLGRFLRLEGIDEAEVTVVDVKPAALTSALAAGDVDAIVATPRFVYEIRQEQGDKVVYWPAEGNQPTYDTLVATDRWIRGHTGTIQRFLRSLSRAQVYVAEKPAAAQAIANKRLGWTDSFMADQWSLVYFSLSLDRSLIVAMESEARWMIAAGLTAEREIPDFYDYVYPEGLEAARPDAVNMGR